MKCIIYIFQVCQICQFTYLSEFYVLGSTFIRGSVNTHLCKKIYIFYLRMKAKLKQFEKKEKRKKKTRQIYVYVSQTVKINALFQTCDMYVA